MFCVPYRCTHKTRHMRASERVTRWLENCRKYHLMLLDMCHKTSWIDFQKPRECVAQNSASFFLFIFVLNIKMPPIFFFSLHSVSDILKSSLFRLLLKPFAVVVIQISFLYFDWKKKARFFLLRKTKIKVFHLEGEKENKSVTSFFIIFFCYLLCT